MWRWSTFTGPDIATAMKAAITSQVSGGAGVRSDRARARRRPRSAPCAGLRGRAGHAGSSPPSRLTLQRAVRLSSPCERACDQRRLASPPRCCRRPRSSTARSTGPSCPATPPRLLDSQPRLGSRDRRRTGRLVGAGHRRELGIGAATSERWRAQGRPCTCSFATASAARIPRANLGGDRVRPAGARALRPLEPRLRARVRRRLQRRAPRAARPGQQRGRDAAAARDHRRRPRAHLRHQRRRPVPAHGPAPSHPAARGTVTSRERLLGRHVHAKARRRRPPAQPPRVRPDRVLRALQALSGDPHRALGGAAARLRSERALRCTPAGPIRRACRPRCRVFAS